MANILWINFPASWSLWTSEAWDLTSSRWCSIYSSALLVNSGYRCRMCSIIGSIPLVHAGNRRSIDRGMCQHFFRGFWCSSLLLLLFLLLLGLGMVSNQQVWICSGLTEGMEAVDAFDALLFLALVFCALAAILSESKLSRLFRWYHFSNFSSFSLHSGWFWERIWRLKRWARCDLEEM